MLNILFTFAISVILTATFFILFFDLDLLEMKSKNRTKDSKNQEPVSTAHGFVEDTYRGPITDRFIPPKYGPIGSFVGYSSVPEYNWLHGFPHEKTK
jgi:hypothetical protein